MDQNTVVDPDNGILFCAKKKWTIKSLKGLEETKIHITKQKKPM